MKSRRYAVFDIDGTLIRWQLYHATVSELAKQNVLGPDAAQTLKQYRMRWKQREHEDAFKAYEQELVQIYENSLQNIDTQLFDKAVETVIQEYKAQVYTYTRNLIKNLKSKGYLLFAISGSHKELVSHIVTEYGFDDYVATSYERKNNQFTGKKFIASLHKRSCLLQLIKKYDLQHQGSIAVGDSNGDIPMLEIVENPIAFNPDKDLFAHAKQCGWKIVIERKNVIYELEPVDGRYVLA